jgi:hypothetical protein
LAIETEQVPLTYKLLHDHLRFAWAQVEILEQRLAAALSRPQQPSVFDVHAWASANSRHSKIRTLTGLPDWDAFEAEVAVVAREWANLHRRYPGIFPAGAGRPTEVGATLDVANVVAAAYAYLNNTLSWEAVGMIFGCGKTYIESRADALFEYMELELVPMAVKFLSRDGVDNELDANRTGMERHHRLVAAVDTFCIFVGKSGSLVWQKKIYSGRFKQRHLVRMTNVVAPSGTVMAVYGPYVGTNWGIDSLICSFELQTREFGKWVRAGDVVIADKGYEDTIAEGVRVVTPKPLGTPDDTRDYWKVGDGYHILEKRWKVEKANRYLKKSSRFSGTIHNQLIPKLRRYCLIAARVTNLYFLQ